MKFTKLFTTVLLLITITAATLEAQSFKDKYFHSFGYMLEVALSPAQEYKALDFNQVEQNFVSQYFYYSVGIQYEGRFNIVNINDNNAFSVSLAPSVGIAIGNNRNDNIFEGDSGFGNINLPAFLNYEIGAGSTFDTDKDFGATVGFGYQFTLFPIFGDVPEGINKSFGMPLFRFSLRKFSNRDNNLREYFIQFWPGSTKTLVHLGQEDDYRSLFIKVGLSKFIGY